MLLAPLLLGLAACGGSLPPCTCIPSPPLRSRADAAAAVSAVGAVFEGRVVRMAYRADSIIVGSESGRVRQGFRLPELEVILVVGRRWKGDLADTVTVRTPAATEACGADFAEGRSYLVFARSRDFNGLGVARPARPGEVVYVTKCGPSTALGREARRIATLLGQPLSVGSAAGRPDAPEA